MRFSVRTLRKTPALVLVAILSIALGIGATTAVFSVIDAVLIHPFPYPGADRMVHIGDFFSASSFLEFQKLDIFDGLVATDFYNMSLTGGDLPDSVKAARMSANGFQVLRIPVLLGREFTSNGRPLDEEPEHSVVLSYSFWQGHYGGDPAVIGKTVQLDREPYTIVGVAPPRFQWKSCDVFLPANLRFFTQPSLQVDGRLKPGITTARAAEQLLAVMKASRSNLPPDFRVRVLGYMEGVQRNFRETLVLFLVAVFALLAVGCANVSILLLARGTARRQELALRAALGASRGQLARQLLTESVLLAFAGGMAGVLLAFGGLAALARWLPSGTFPAEADLHVNLSVLYLSTGVSLLAGILSGSAPALRFSMPRLHEALQGLARRATAGAGSRRAQNILVAVQVALTIVLLAGAGAAVHTLLGLYRTQLGFDPHNILMVTVPTLEGENSTFDARRDFFERIKNQVTSLPEARFVALSGFNPPFYGANQSIDLPGEARDPARRVMTQFVSPQYFSVFGIPMLRGRTWTDAENTAHANVAVINQAMASRFWPNGDPIGQRFRMPALRGGQFVLAAPGSTDWMEIIGVVGDVRNRGLKEPPGPAAYAPFTMMLGDNMQLSVRTRSNPMGILRALREQIHIAAPGQPIGPGPRTGEDVVRNIGWAREELVSSLFTGFATLALVLAAIGLYSAVSYASALRSQEFGIRIALGARQADVIRLVMVPAARIVGAGIAAGLVLSLMANTALAHWTTVRVNDPWAMASIVAVLAGVAAIAAIIPARRAVRQDPMIALRQ